MSNNSNSGFMGWVTNPITLLVVFAVLVGGGYIMWNDAQMSKKIKQENLKKACFANQRVLAGATEMYNMDNKILIESFSDETMSALVNEKYLRQPVICPEGGQYESKGDLKDDGIIGCTLHGYVFLNQ